MRVVGGGGYGQVELPTPRQEEIYARAESLRVAIEWARSAGPEHATRVPPEEMIAAAEAFYAYMVKAKP